MSQSETMQLVAGHGLGAAEAENRVVAVLVLEQLVNVDAVGIVEAAVFLGDADDLVAVLHHQAGGIGADVAEALNDDAAAVDGHVEIAQALVADHHARRGRWPQCGRASRRC